MRPKPKVIQKFLRRMRRRLRVWWRPALLHLVLLALLALGLLQRMTEASEASQTMARARAAGDPRLSRLHAANAPDNGALTTAP